MGIHLNVDFRGIQGSDPAFSEAAFEASVEEELRQVKKQAMLLIDRPRIVIKVSFKVFLVAMPQKQKTI